MTDSNNRKMGIILSYISIAVNSLIQLIYTPLLISNMGQSEYGLYSLISSVIGYLTVLDLGFGNAIIVYTAKYRAQGKVEEENKLHGMFKIIFILIGCFATILGLILFFNVENMFSNTLSVIEMKKAKIMMLILSFNLGITFFFSIYSSIISAYEKFVFQKILSLINSLLKPILMIPFLFLGFKSVTMVVIITIVNVFVLLAQWLYCRNKLNVRIKFHGFDKIMFKTIFGYSIWLFLGTVVDKINWNVDQFILGAVSGTIAVSIYSVAGQLNMLFINLSTAISNVFLPKMSKMIANNCSNDDLTNEMLKVGRIQLYIIYLAITGFILFGKEFIGLWAGSGFEESYYVALVLIIPAGFPLIQNLGLSIMQSMNKYKFKSVSTFIMAIFNLILSIFLAQQYGAIGAAIGTAIGQIVCNIILINVYYYKQIKLNILKFWENIFKMIIKFLPITLIVIIFICISGFSGIYKLCIGGILYMFLFSLVSYFFVMNDYEKQVIKKVIKKLK